MGQKKKKEYNEAGEGRKEEARGKYRMEPMIVNWSHHV